MSHNIIVIWFTFWRVEDFFTRRLICVTTQSRKKLAELLIVIALFVATAAYIAFSPLFPAWNSIYKALPCREILTFCHVVGLFKKLSVWCIICGPRSTQTHLGKKRNKYKEPHIVSTETRRKVTQLLIIAGLFAANLAYLSLSPLFPS